MSETIRSPKQNDPLELFQACTPIFQALGDPVRQQLILLLAQHERLNVTMLAAESPMSRPTISHHLKILRQAGIVNSVKEGTEQFYSLKFDPWLDRLKKLIEAVEQECTLE